MSERVRDPSEHPQLDNPHEHANDDEQDASLRKLMSLRPPGSGDVIAVDLDDVLSQTNRVLAEWHNDVYGSAMSIATFYYYYWWKNPYWGTPKETEAKVKIFHDTNRVQHAPPVAGAREGVQALRDMGYRLVVVTARNQEEREDAWTWLEQHFPGMFDTIVCTNQFSTAHGKGHEVLTRLGKNQVCRDLGAVLLIDDSLENAFSCATASDPTRVLVFGDYEWNKRITGPEDATDAMSFDIRLKANGGKEFWKEEITKIPENAPMWRVRDWGEAVRWVQTAKAQGRLNLPL